MENPTKAKNTSDMELQKLTCRNCGYALRAQDLNMEHAIARCAACDSVFSFAHLLPRQEAQAAVKARPRVAKPRRFRVEQWGAELTISYRWFSPAAFFLIPFCIFWDGFLIMWYSIALTTGAPIVMLIFPIIHVLVGIGITYTALSMLVNRTIIRVDPLQMSIRHKPLPWMGTRDIDGGDVQQLFCTRKQRKNGSVYTVNVLDGTGHKVRLLEHITELDDAIFIEQQIEDHLGLQDRPVSGEVAVGS